MPRLIDADALYQSFGASGNCNDCSLDAYKCQYYNEHTLMEFCERIEDAPTVDAVPVVRCKDCKWQITAYCPMPSWERKDNHYCHKGAKMDEEE